MCARAGEICNWTARWEGKACQRHGDMLASKKKYRKIPKIMPTLFRTILLYPYPVLPEFAIKHPLQTTKPQPPRAG
jgi:hypothetical protein